MAVPARRTGVTKKRIRRGHIGLEATNTYSCPNCGAAIRPHHVCPNCGFYKGRKVVDVKSKAE